MCFKRKPGLGHYDGSREQWSAAYHSARILAKRGMEPNAKLSGLRWKACLIVAYERQPEVDHLTMPIEARLFAKRLIDSMVGEAVPA